MNRRELKQYQVSEFNAEGYMLHQLSRSIFSMPQHIAVDSQGNIFVLGQAKRHIPYDSEGRMMDLVIIGYRCVVLLDPQLALRRVIIDESQLCYNPRRLYYNHMSGQLLVGFEEVFVAVFDVLQP